MAISEDADAICASIDKLTEAVEKALPHLESIAADIKRRADATSETNPPPIPPQRAIAPRSR